MTVDMTFKRAGMRILRFLAKGNVAIHKAAEENKLLLVCSEGRAIGADTSVVILLEKAALLQRTGASLSLTDAGHSALKIMTQTSALSCAQPQKPDHVAVASADEFRVLTINQAESPLNLLYRRKGKNGRTFIDAREFHAGERLRADYTRGQIMPRLGINWSGAAMAGKSHDRAGGIIELTDAALAARRRVEKAIEAVGPELAGVLIDICCFLKGMEQVEMERSWPARSAKVVLKSALSALARHYEPLHAKDGRHNSRPTVLHWGTQDYRPAIKTGAS